MNNKSPIGFFDSGIGGLSVYSEFKKILPNENTIYFGDLANMPYGNKTEEELISFGIKILDYFKNRGVKSVVIACNTSSAVVYDKIKNLYDFKIYPIIQSCAKVIAENTYNNVVVLATAATVKTKAYTRELKKYSPNTNVYEIPCPLWTSFVEEGKINSEECFQDVKEKTELAKTFNPDKIILGCTHYPYLINTLTKFVPEEKFLNPAQIFTEYIFNDLKLLNLLNNNKQKGDEEFIVSANPESFKENSKLFYQADHVSLC